MYHKQVIQSIRQVKINIIIKTLILSDFILFSANNLTQAIFAIFIIENIPGATIVHVGFASTIFLIAKSLFEIPVGLYIDKSKNEKRHLCAMLIGSLIQAVVYLLYAFIGSVWELYLLNGLYGLGNALSYPGWRAIFSKHVDKGREGYEWSVYDVMIAIGMAGSATIGGLFVANYGFTALFYVGSALTLVGSLVLLFIKPALSK